MSRPIVGVDEVGLGAWAGPLVVCAFAAPDGAWFIEGLNDSKKIRKKVRPLLARELMRQFPGCYELVAIPPDLIDTEGLGRAHQKAMAEAIYRLIDRVGVPDRVIVDGLRQPIAGAECYPKADGTYPAVMAASIIAKVARDDYMVQAAMTYPGYGFERHVGYGVKQHQKALQQLGLCPLHRRSYAPIRVYLQP